MNAKREQWSYLPNAKVWAGRFKNSHNAPHWHYDCELLFVENGELGVFCNGKFYTMHAGQAFFINSEQVHYMHAKSPDTVITMFVFDYGLIKSFANGTTPDCPLLSEKYNLRGLYDEIKEQLSAGQKFYGEYSSCLITMKMIEMFRTEHLVPKEKRVRTVERLKLLLTDIDEKFEFYDLKTAADFMGMNPAYFSRLFHKLTGINFSQYLNYVRCRKAVELLNSGQDISITEVAFKCGFETIRNFNLIFKAFTGYTPKSLPKDFVMNESFTSLNETSHNPTSVECELLESTDD